MIPITFAILTASAAMFGLLLARRRWPEVRWLQRVQLLVALAAMVLIAIQATMWLLDIPQRFAAGDIVGAVINIVFGSLMLIGAIGVAVIVWVSRRPSHVTDEHFLHDELAYAQEVADEQRAVDAMLKSLWDDDVEVSSAQLPEILDEAWTAGLLDLPDDHDEDLHAALLTAALERAFRRHDITVTREQIERGLEAGARAADADIY